MPSTAKDALLGRTIAQRYRLISRLGAGSAASVYLARHVLIERLSAIKIVHPELARDAVWRERFLREARAVNRINHPNIVEITDLGEADGFLFLVMEYVPGESLRQVLDRGPLGFRRAAHVGLQVAGALGRAHQMGRRPPRARRLEHPARAAARRLRRRQAHGLRHGEALRCGAAHDASAAHRGRV